MNVESISNILYTLPPAKRIKFIRQKILKQNQIDFCSDGIIREGTLKSIESERIKIGEKIAERIIHKLKIEGVFCSKELFLEQSSPCDIKIDLSKKSS